jgi:signal transduction histidine kinase
MAAIAAPVPDAASGYAPAPRLSLLLAGAVGGGAAAGISVSLALTNDAISAELGEPLVIALLSVSVTLSYVLCGLFAWSRRPESRFGPLMIAAGFANFAATLSWASSDLPFTIGQAFDLIPPVLFLHVFLAFPSGRLEGRFERALVAAAYATAIGFELARMLFGGFGPHNLLEVTSNPGIGDALTRIQLLLVSAMCLAGVGVLALRRRRAGPPLRRSLGLLVDAFALGLVMIAFLFVSLVFGGPAVQQIRWAALITLALAPLAFLVALLRARLARTEVGGLFVELRRDPAPRELQAALARTLRDPSLTLAYWLPEFASYADLDGRPVPLPAEDERRAVRLIEREGARLAALLHDPSLNDEPELLDAVTAAAGIALENARLQAELGARLQELRGSRVRILEAGRKERQRLERNLHDGAQQRLVALSLELSLLEEDLAGDAKATARLALARDEIAASLAELREVARGLHPAVVSGHGLAVALEQLVARAPVPVRLSVDVGSRLPEALEVAAYYLISESLANVGKHACASSAGVAVTRNGDEVLVEVVDDGIGGADTELGSGLRGLADRIETLGGHLRVWSPQGGGTRVRAEIPCVQ